MGAPLRMNATASSCLPFPKAQHNFPLSNLNGESGDPARLWPSHLPGDLSSLFPFPLFKNHELLERTMVALKYTSSSDPIVTEWE